MKSAKRFLDKKGEFSKKRGGAVSTLLFFENSIILELYN